MHHSHLRDLILDEDRAKHFSREHNGVFMDFSRQNVILPTMKVGGQGSRDLELLVVLVSPFI